MSKLTGKSTLRENHTKKMAKAVFKPVDPLTVRNADERYTYRWLNKAKLEKQGGINAGGREICNSLSDGNDKEENKGFQNSSHAIDGTTVSGDLVLARMPKEMAESRNDYYANKQNQKDEIMGVKKRLGDNGTVQFESKQGRNSERY